MSSAKKYSCLKYGKRTKSTSGLTRYLNACIKKVPQTVPLPIYHKLHNDKKDILDGDLEENLEDGSEMLDKTNYTIRDVTYSPTKNKPWDGLLASKFLSLLGEEWFTRNEFPVGIPISNIKYNHPKVKHQNSFYPFNDQLNYALAYYFAESETTKGNVNKFLSDLLMTLLTKKLSYKNTDE